ncbi:hypothetical protein B0G81_7664 [Paraburkholderia sp. BL6665CI2N2]|nr:hypothetical protein B0G81_7664 [Paraburkholderia sp. BL6665CI2N2]
MRIGGQAVLGIGATMRKGGDVIDLGKALDAKSAELQATLPAGLKLAPVLSMPHAVKHSVDELVRSVGEAVAIVLVAFLTWAPGFGQEPPVANAVTRPFERLLHIMQRTVMLGTARRKG